MLRSIGRIDIADLSRVLGVEDRLQLALRMCALARWRWQRTRRRYGDDDADHERKRGPDRQRQESFTHLPLPVGCCEKTHDTPLNARSPSDVPGRSLEGTGPR